MFQYPIYTFITIYQTDHNNKHRGLPPDNIYLAVSTLHHWKFLLVHRMTWVWFGICWKMMHQSNCLPGPWMSLILKIVSTYPLELPFWQWCRDYWLQEIDSLLFAQAWGLADKERVRNDHTIVQGLNHGWMKRSYIVPSILWFLVQHWTRENQCYWNHRN